MPCAATLSLLFRQLDRTALEHALSQWVLSVLTKRGSLPVGSAIDGKTLCGSRTQGAPLTHLLRAVTHQLGLTVGQIAVPAKTNETTVLHSLVRHLPLVGQVVTVDALLEADAD